MTTRRRRIWKVARAVLGGLLLLLTVPLLLVHLALLVPPVRDLVRDKAAALASDALKAKVQIDRLDALSMIQLRASGIRVLAPTGDALASLERLQVDINPFALAFMQLSLRNVELDRPYVDLGDPGGKGGGLLGLFPSEAAEPEPKKSEPSNFEVVLSRLWIQRGRVDVQAAGAHYRLHSLDTELSARIGPALGAHVSRLAATVLRDEREVAAIVGTNLGYGGDGAIRARLQIRAGETQLEATASLGGRNAQGAQALQAQLQLQQLSAETLASFGVDAATLTAPVDLTARAQGTTHDLTYAATLATPGGDVNIAGAFAPPGLAATIRTQQLDARRFLDVELEPISARLELRGSQDPDTELARLDAELVSGSYGGGDLPHVQAHARRTARGDLILDQLEARYPQGRLLSAKGRQGSDGALSLDAQLGTIALHELPPVQKLDLPFAGVLQGEVQLVRAPRGSFTARSYLQLTQARLDTMKADALTLRVDAHGAVDRPELVLELHAADFNVARTQLPRVDLTVAGGPSEYFITGRFADRGALQASVERAANDAIKARAKVSLAVDKGGVRRPLRAEIGELSYDPKGAVTARNVKLSYRDARASLEGGLDPDKRGELRARVHIPRLQELTELVMEKPIEGSVELTANVRGATSAPQLNARVAYRAKALYGLKNLAVDLSADGDVPAKRVALELKARSHAGSVEAAVRSELRAARADAAAFMDGRHDVSVRFDRFLLSELSVWPRETVVPIAAALSGEIHVKGRLKAPELSTDLQSAMKFGGEAGKLQMSLRGGYKDEHLAFDIHAEDRRGPLLRTRLETDLTRTRISRDPDLVKRVLRERSWQASLWLGGRRLEELPMLRALQIPEAALPAQLSAQLDLKHQPGVEPEGRFQMRAAWEPPGSINAKEMPKQIASDKAKPTRCGMDNRPAFDLDVRMGEGELRSELTASLEGKPAFVMRTESHAPIDEWFQAEPSKIRPAGAALQFTDLRLKKMPIACEFVDGVLSGHAEIRRALTTELASSLDLHASHLRWGTAPPFDAHVSGTADRQMLKATTKLQAANGSALITTNLPLEPRGRLPGVKLDAAAYGRVAIHNMDVRALLGPVPGVRATSGTLDSDLTLTGTILNPDVRGNIAVRDTTVTLAELGQRVERVTGDLKLAGRTVTVQRLLIHDRDGKAEVTGSLNVPEFGTYRGEIVAKADNFPVRKTGVLLARFNGSANLKADVTPEKTVFDLTLHSARIELSDEDMGGVQPLRANPEIVFSDAGQHEVERVTETPTTPLTFNIDASEPFWVTRSDFSVLVSTKMKVEAVEGPVSVTGSVNIDRGFVELIGQSFDIEQGHIEFTGGREVEPTLDLVASKRVPGGSKVTIKATGTLRQPQLAFFVDDEAVTAGEALAAASGSRTSGSDSTVQQQVSSMATGLAAGVLTLGARRELGEWMPVLSIDSGENGPSVRAGIQADRFIPSFLRGVVVDAYVEGILASGGNEGSGETSSGGGAMPAALLELRFPHDLVGEAQYGPGDRWSVDIGWEP